MKSPLFVSDRRNSVCIWIVVSGLDLVKRDHLFGVLEAVCRGTIPGVPSAYSYSGNGGKVAGCRG